MSAPRPARNTPRSTRRPSRKAKRRPLQRGRRAFDARRSARGALLTDSQLAANAKLVRTEENAHRDAPRRRVGERQICRVKADRMRRDDKIGELRHVRERRANARNERDAVEIASERRRRGDGRRLAIATIHRALERVDVHDHLRHSLQRRVVAQRAPVVLVVVHRIDEAPHEPTIATCALVVVEGWTRSRLNDRCRRFAIFGEWR